MSVAGKRKQRLALKRQRQGGGPANSSSRCRSPTLRSGKVSEARTRLDCQLSRLLSLSLTRSLPSTHSNALRNQANHVVRSSFPRPPATVTTCSLHVPRGTAPLTSPARHKHRFASSAKDRLSGLVSQLSAPNAGAGKAALLAQNPNDVVIVAACRTPITRARKGGLKDTCQEELLKVVFEDVIKRAGVDKSLVEEIQVGNVLPPGGGATVARMAQLAG